MTEVIVRWGPFILLGITFVGLWRVNRMNERTIKLQRETIEELQRQVGIK